MQKFSISGCCLSLLLLRQESVARFLAQGIVTDDHLFANAAELLLCRAALLLPYAFCLGIEYRCVADV